MSGTGIWAGERISSGQRSAWSMIALSFTRSSPSRSRSRIANFATATFEDRCRA